MFMVNKASCVIIQVKF